MLTRRSLATSVLGAALTPGAARAAATEQVFAREALLADLDEIVPTLQRIHPNLSFTAVPAELHAHVSMLRRRLDRPMTVRQAWRVMAQLNPLLRDAHMGLRHPVAEFEDYGKAGGAIFPTPVFVDRAGLLRVAETAPSNGEVRPLDVIETINGLPSAKIVGDMAPLMRGETQSLQRLVMAVNFPALLWTLYGPQGGFRLVVRSEGTPSRTVTASAGAPAPRRAEDVFRLSTPVPGVALLKVGSFDPTLKAEFAAFLVQAFREIGQNAVRTLIVDVRDNPGGAHDLSDLLVARLADRAVSPASRLVARITPDNRDLKPDAKVGDVVSVPFDDPIQPAAPQDRFKGKVFVLASQDTYSQAIVFVATLKDNDLATVVGETTGGNANQTGQITLNPLPHTRLQVLAPLYVIYRPNGDESVGGLRPDIAIAHQPERPGVMIETLLRNGVIDPST